MIHGGYYIKARKIQNSLIAVQPPHVREIWDWLIKEANHSESKYAGFTINRGQLFRTYDDIREGLHWMVGWRKMTYNENQTKKAMKFLRDAGMIDTKKELGGVLITVCNYDTYQNPNNYERTTNDTSERTIEEPLKNHPIPDNNKKNKNVNIYSEFYDAELEFSKNDENYQKYLDHIFGKNSLNRKFTKILAMRDQLTFEQFKTLRDKIFEFNKLGKDKISLKNYIEQYENGNYKKTSVYLTFNNWINREYKANGLTWGK